VLGIGLGYGTVAQKIMESGAIYSGLDIAAGPVHMANHRASQIQAHGEALQGNALQAPFEDATFDFVIAIGSLHHTGALDVALGEVHRLLVPGGSAMVMVYNSLSYRQWTAAPLKTVKRIFSDPDLYVSHNENSERMRNAYDINTDGSGAPQTEFVTPTEFRALERF